MMLPGKRNVRSPRKNIDMFEEQGDYSIADGAMASKKSKLEDTVVNTPSLLIACERVKTELRVPGNFMMAETPQTAPTLPDGNRAGQSNGCGSPSEISSLKSEDLNMTIADATSTLKAFPFITEQDIEVINEISGCEFPVIDLSDEDSETSTRPASPDNLVPSVPSQPALAPNKLLYFLDHNIVFDKSLLAKLAQRINMLDIKKNQTQKKNQTRISPVDVVEVDDDDDDVVILSPPQTTKKILSPPQTTKKILSPPQTTKKILSPPQTTKKILSPPQTTKKINSPEHVPPSIINPVPSETLSPRKAISSELERGKKMASGTDYSVLPMDISPKRVVKTEISKDLLRDIVKTTKSCKNLTFSSSSEVQDGKIVQTSVQSIPDTKRPLLPEDDLTEKDKKRVRRAPKKMDVKEYWLRIGPRRKELTKNTANTPTAVSEPQTSTSLTNIPLSASISTPPFPVLYRPRSQAFAAAPWSNNFPETSNEINRFPRHFQPVQMFKHAPISFQPAFQNSYYLQTPNTPMNVAHMYQTHNNLYAMPQSPNVPVTMLSQNTRMQQFQNVPVAMQQQVHNVSASQPQPGQTTLRDPRSASSLHSANSSSRLPHRPRINEMASPPEQHSLSCSSTSSQPFLLRKPQGTVPNSFKQFAGVRVVHSDHLHLLILNWEVASMYQLFQKKEFKSLVAVFRQVRNSYSDHLHYYNTYFPLMLIEYWNKLFLSYESTARCEYFYHVTVIKLNKTSVPELEEEIDTWLMECDTIVPTSDVPFNPKEKHVLLVSCLAGQFLAFVRMSVRRDFSVHHDSQHPTVERNSVSLGPSPKSKVKIELEFACSPPPMSIGDVFKCRKLASLKSLLRQNEALLHLRTSRMMKPLLDMKAEIVELSLKQEQMALALDAISQRVLNFDHQITLVASQDISPLANIVARLHSDLRRPILVCTREENLSTTALLLQPLKINFVLLDRELRRDIGFKDRSLDFLAKERSEAPNRVSSIQPVIEDCDVMVASTMSCFYDDVNVMAKFDTCLLFDADRFTEPESIVCLSYDVRHLVLIGCPGKVCATTDIMTSNWDFGKSLFKRAYDMN